MSTASDILALQKQLARTRKSLAAALKRIAALETELSRKD